jgi:hypothetical protein
VSGVHAAIGYGVVGLFAVGWLLGLGAWVVRRDPGRVFWVWLTVAQVAAAVQVLVGVVLYLSGRRAETLLHYAYGFFPLLVLVAAHVVARETRRMKPSPRTGRTMAPWVPFAWAAFICFGLTLRGLMTGLGIG